MTDPNHSHRDGSSIDPQEAQSIQQHQLPITVIIPTKNEERNLKDCLESVSFAAERIVFDSFSTDSTVEIARAYGARIVQREFDVFSTHKNWAMNNIAVEHDWTLLLDADERVTPELQQEIARVMADPDAVEGYYIARKNVFAGRWIRHCGMYPDRHLRLFRTGAAQYEERTVHEHMVVNGEVGYVRNHLLHHDYKGVERYIERHNHYSSLEAVEVHRMLRGRADATIEGDIWMRGPHRRRALKNFAYRYLPMRSLLVFIYMYVLRLGFMDGRIGFRYCLLRTFYEYQISLKLAELRDQGSPMAKDYRQYLGR